MRSPSPRRCWLPAYEPWGRRAPVSPPNSSCLETRATSDFQTLTPQLQTLLQIKLDGYIEACLLAARQQNIGLEEALQLTCRALLREFVAYGRGRDVTRALLLQAWQQAYQEPAAPEAPRLM